MATLAPTIAHRRDELIATVGAADGVGELFGAASERLRRLVPFDAAVWLAVDPATSLPTAPTRSENLGRLHGREDCLRIWEREFLVEDVNLYSDLARSRAPAGGLRMATRDRPARSARYREFLRPHGFEDELRAVMRVAGSPWGAVSLFRDEGEPAFDADEIELVASLSSPLAEGVREHARPASRVSPGGEGRGPGLMVFAPDGELISVNDDALAWLDELPADSREPEAAFEVGMPMVVVGTLMSARAIAEDRDHRPARARIRARSGGWLVCHASCLRGANGAIANTALVIEPANAVEIVPMIVQAYELSARERQITELISQGFGTAEIAAMLHLSVHTVRDYIKAIFDKVGVSSRGELVAKLFAEHYAPIHLHPSGLEVVGE